MNPNQQPQGPQAYGPNNYGPVPQPQQGAPLPVKSSGNSRLPLIIAAVVGVLFVLIVGGILVLSSTSKKTVKPTVDPNQNTQQGPQPATSIVIEQTSNSISQDISGQNDDKDLPDTMLDDKTLGL